MHILESSPKQLKVSVPIKEKSTENVVQTYLSLTQAKKVETWPYLSDNDTEFKNIVSNVVCDQVGIERLFCNLFNPQGSAKVDNVHNFLKGTLTKFLDYTNLEWDELLPFTCYCYNIFPGRNGTESPFFLIL